MGSCKKAINVVNVGARTINLAKDLSRRRKPPISECKPYFPGSGSHPLGGSIPPPPATHIRVCTPEQLRSICPSDPCECPEPPPPPTTTQKVVRGSLFVAKVMLVLGICKWTCDLGIWGNTESTSALSRDAYEKLGPALGKSDEEDDDSGSYYGLTYNLATMWNTGVNNVFYVIGVLPSILYQKLFGTCKLKKEDEDKTEEASSKGKLKKPVPVQRYY